MPNEPAQAPLTAKPTVWERIVDELAYAYEGLFPREAVARAVTEARQSFESVSRIPDYVPILTARYAKDQLKAAAQAEGRIAKQVPEILFICVHNAGRSQMAAALAQHLSAGRVHVRSAGSAPTGEINPSTIEVLRERGIDLTEAYPKPLSDSVVQAADVIVTMGCGDVCPIYPGKRYLDWDVPDPAGQPLDVVRDIRDDIQGRVTALLRDLGV